MDNRYDNELYFQGDYSTANATRLLTQNGVSRFQKFVNSEWIDLEVERLGGPVLFDDFLGDVIADQWGVRKGSDGQAVDFAINAQVGGAIRATTGDDAAADMTVNGVQLESALNWKASAGGLSMTARVRIEAITTCSLFVGFTDQVSALEAPIVSAASADTITTNATDAVGFMFDTAMDTDTFWLVGVANNVDATKQAVSNAPVAATYITLRVDVTAAGVATFFIDGLQVGAAMTGAVTASVALTPVITFFRRAATATYVDCDFIKVKQNRV
jgi:hypothetical protein